MPANTPGTESAQRPALASRIGAHADRCPLGQHRGEGAPRVPSPPRGGARPLPGGWAPVAPFGPRGGASRPEPLLTAAESAAVAGLAEGAAGAAHRGAAAAGRSAARRASAATGPGPTRYPPRSPDPARRLRGAEVPATAGPGSRGCGAQAHSGPRGGGAHLGGKGAAPRAGSLERRAAGGRGQGPGAARGEGGRGREGRRAGMEMMLGEVEGFSESSLGRGGDGCEQWLWIGGLHLRCGFNLIELQYSHHKQV